MLSKNSKISSRFGGLLASRMGLSTPSRRLAYLAGVQITWEALRLHHLSNHTLHQFSKHYNVL